MKATTRELNLELGRPTADEALRRLEAELEAARHMNTPLLKLIHGYGSSGKGGRIRTASRKYLLAQQEKGRIAAVVLGEELCLLQQAADGTIEGFCHETLPILGVQWHPERQSGARLRADAVDAGPLLRYFVGQCSCKSAPGLVHCEKRGEADESHHTGTKSGAGTAYGG